MATTIKLELFKSKILKDGSNPIMIRITQMRRNKYINTGFSAFPDEWDSPAQTFTNRYKRNHRLTDPQFDMIKNALAEKLNSANTDKIELQKKKKQVNVDELTSKIKNIQKQVDFYSYSQGIIDNNRKSGKVGNAAVYEMVKSLVKTFMKDGKKTEKPLLLTDITFKWLKDFETWHLSKGNTINSLSVYMRTIRAVFNRAISENLISRDLYPFGNGRYKISNSPTQKRAIAKADIEKIRNTDFPENSSLWHTKNYFLFSFYCRGMNWVDMANLRLKNVINGRIEYIRIKTMRKSGKSFSIKITGQMESILNWYCTGKEPNDYIFPIVQRPNDPELARNDIKNGLKTFNKYLRQIAKICGIQGNLTSYVARHSWGTIAKKMGVDIATISDGYGHADMQVTQTYLDSIENEEIDKANALITG
ncbi:MAG: site-specific integrase [Bacteroidales bacterium]|nr:site-specific integrase [Bacteroidales bacterium]